MDGDVINNKLESLARCVHRIENRLPKNQAELEKDIDMQDILVLNLERAVQICVDIASHLLLDFAEMTPQSMSDAFRLLFAHHIIPAELAENLAHAVGFRNIAVHQYQSIDWNIVFSIVTKNLDDFRAFAGYISNKAFGA